jgi:hypothetical protein
MSTIGNILKATLVTTSLLLAAAANAGDVTSDRAQTAANAKPAAVETHRHADGMTCHCAAPAPKVAPEKSLLDDPNFTGYQAG